MKTLQAVVAETDHGVRVWKFALQLWKDTIKSREQMRQSFKRGEVTVNGEIAEVTRILSTDDVVQVRFDLRAAHKSIYGKEQLDIRYEDDELAIVVKPSGKTMVNFGFTLPYSLQSSNKAHTASEQEGDEDLEIPIEEENGADDDDDDDFEVPVNVSPAVGIQRVPCAIHGLEKAANGLILVAKTVEMRQTLLRMFIAGEISRTFRVICHGAFTQSPSESTNEQNQPQAGSQQQQQPTSDTPADNLLEGSLVPIDTTIDDAPCIGSIKIAQISHSNESGHISTLEIQPTKGFMGVNIRRYLLAANHPMVGDSSNTRPLKANRNKGLMSALVRMEFAHPTTGVNILATLEEPAKFEQLRVREDKARLKRKLDETEELRKGGLEDVENYDRKSNLPIAYMVGEKEFCGMRFKVSPATLIPRSSTETLVQAAKDLSRTRSAVKILDVGTGSGCLLLALVHSLPGSTGTGVDISEEALQVAGTNAELHHLTDRVRFQYGDLGFLQGSKDIFQEYDILVCNPPYLDSSKATRLKKTFAGTEHEPEVALFAEKGGYGAYELLANSLWTDVQLHKTQSEGTSSDGHRQPQLMAKGGYVILEIGSGMSPRVKEIFKFLRFEQALKDNQDSDRCLVFSMPVDFTFQFENQI
ncbi:hypothetical protein BGZ83_011969 [Gryganskiella cystojenkinii]|nr:hypothetical protein BGZ83_011969 [Gryganskiella cystojenkinii]